MTARKLNVGRSGLAALATSVAALFALHPAHGQFEITGAAGNTAQNFDTLINTGTNQLWTNDTTLTLGDSTLNGWSLFNSTSNPISAYSAGDGGTNTGSFYSFGTPSATERALGGTASGGAYFGSPASGAVAGYIAFSATNNSTATLNSFTLGFDGEQWRNGGNTNAQTMTLQYGFGAGFTDVLNWITPGGNFDWASPIATGTPATVDGNVAGLVANRGGVVNGLDWQTGQTLWIRWIEVNDTGNDHGLGIDNFTLSWSGTSIVPLYWDPNGAQPGIGGVGTWSATDNLNLNWNPALAGDGVPQTSDATKRLVFGGIGGAVTIDGSVAANIGIEATAPYTITGGTLTLGSVPSINISDTLTINSQIAGANGLIKLGTGTLTLTNSTNSFTGDISISAGALSITDDAQLGVGPKTLSISGGLLSLSGDFILSASRTLSGSGAIRIPAGKTLTVQGTVNLPSVEISGDAVAHNAGPTVTLTGATNSIGNLSLPDPVTINAAGGLTLTGNVTIAVGVSTSSSINAPVTLGTGIQRFTILDTPDLVDFTLNGSLSGTGRIHKIGDGTLRLVGATTAFTGGVRIGSVGAVLEPGGRLLISDKGSLGTGQLEFNAGTLEAEANLTGANALTASVSLGATTASPAIFAGMPMEFLGDISVFRTQAGEQQLLLQTDVTFRGFAVSQGTPVTAGLRVTGDTARTLTFSGTATTPGTEAINVEGPTLVVKGALTGSTVSIRSGGLRGVGPIGSLLTIGDDLGSDDAILEPGLGIGTLNLMSLTLLSDAVVRIQIDLLNGLADQIVTTDFVTLGLGTATLSIDFVNGSLQPGTFVIMDNGPLGLVSGKFDGLDDDSSFDVNGRHITIDYTGGPNSNDIVLTIVPEPASSALLAIGAMTLGLRRRRR